MKNVFKKIEIRNQARVHLWYQKKFEIEYPSLTKTTDGIDRFLAKACQVGVRISKNRDNEIYSPSGFSDLAQMLIRPNRCSNFKMEPYLEKAVRWKKLWPELTILDA